MWRSNVLRSVTSAVAVGSLCAAVLVGAATSASAATAPPVPLPASGVSADALPTVQVNGVVWSQVVVGNTVYAAGSFANARPAGAAPGTQLTARTNVLAYSITTGQLITSFNPQVNAQVLSIAAAPDGSRIYIGGDFSSVNGVAKNKVAALDPVTGALVTSFTATGVGGQVRAVAATANAVYVGGGFNNLGNGTPRPNLAAFRASDGAVLPWNPSADYTVWAVTVSTDGQWVFAGGSFTHVNGLDAYGLAKINATSGVLDTTWKPVVRNAGPDTGISSLKVQGAYVYGTSWTYGAGGNLEGAFKLQVTSSTAEWVVACHGDMYSIFMTGGVVYTSGHAHYCGAMGGGFPQYPAWRYQHSLAWTDAVGGEIMSDQLNHTNWHPLANAPSLVGWLPTMGIGSYTGIYQAGWSVDGQQRLRRLRRGVPDRQRGRPAGAGAVCQTGSRAEQGGPAVPVGPFTPRLVPTSSSSVRVSWVAGYDRDDYTLTYKRGPQRRLRRAAAHHHGSSSWWSLPTVGFVDTGLTPGATYQYQLVANDPSGNTVYGTSASITMPHVVGGVERLRPVGAGQRCPHLLADERGSRPDRQRPGRRHRGEQRHRRDRRGRGIRGGLEPAGRHRR